MEKLSEKQLSDGIPQLMRTEITYNLIILTVKFYRCEGQQFKEFVELLDTKVAKEITPFRYKIKHWAKMANVTHIEYEIYVYNSFVSAVTGDT